MIRAERAGDAAAIREVHRAAFPTAVEATLVDRLRTAARAPVSLVAEADGRVVGHILFSPVTFETAGGGVWRMALGVGLAPLAVLPAYQRRGLGSALVEAGLAACRAAGFGYAVVLGVPGFYGRFGFRRASLRGLGNEYGADEHFMALELGGPLPGDGVVKYAPEFAGLDGAS